MFSLLLKDLISDFYYINVWVLSKITLDTKSTENKETTI